MIEHPINKEKDMYLIGLYLAVVGGATAAAKVGRGLVRSGSKLAAGEPRAALVELVAGIASPIAAAYKEATALGDDVFKAVGLLTDDEQVEGTEAPAAALPKAAKRGRLNATPSLDTLPT